MAAKPVAQATFARERETKGAWRYQEETAEGAEPVIGTVYVRKAGLSGEAPTRISVVITAA